MKLGVAGGSLVALVVSLTAFFVGAGAQDTELDHVAAIPLVARDTPFTEPIPGSSFEIAFLDVGQGDATLITIGDERLLIDAGRGALTYQRLEALGIDDLDAIVATHPDADHIGGFARLFEEYQIERVYLNGGMSGSQTFAGFMLAVVNEAGFVRTLTRGDVIGLGGIALEVLHPGDLSDNSNEDSVVLSLTCGEVDVLLTGDATLASEEAMLQAGLLRDYDVLKVGHHGSDTSTGQAFLDVVQPEYAIISAGRTNQFNHPHESVVERLEEMGAFLIGTDVTEGDDTLLMTSDCETVSFSRIDVEIVLPTSTPTPTEPVPTPTPTLAPTPTATPTTLPGIPGSVEITTVFYDPVDAFDASGEYVVLTNTGPTPVQMGNWRIDDETGVFYTFPAFVLDPAASVVVHNCTGIDGPSDRYTGACQAVWNNNGDVATLFNAEGEVVDQYVYGPGD